jgi:hypothetical protein
MALEHKTLIGGLNIDRNGNASVLLYLVVVDGATEYSQENHRIPIMKGENLAQKAAVIDTILLEKGRALLPAKDKSVIGQTLTACWAAMDAP